MALRAYQLCKWRTQFTLNGSLEVEIPGLRVTVYVGMFPLPSPYRYPALGPMYLMGLDISSVTETIACEPRAAKQLALLLFLSPVSASRAACQNRKRKCQGWGGGRRYALLEVPPFSSVVRPEDRDQGAWGTALNPPCPDALSAKKSQHWP